MAEQLTSQDVGAGARAKINAAIVALNTLLGQITGKASQAALDVINVEVDELRGLLDSKAGASALADEVATRGQAIQNLLNALNAGDASLLQKLNEGDANLLKTLGDSDASILKAANDGDAYLLKLLNDSDAGILKAAFDSDARILTEVNASAGRLVARAEATDAAVNNRFDVIETSTPNARPGDMPSAFTRFTIGGVPEFLPNIAALVAVGDNGRVLRISGPDERAIVMRRHQPIERGRRYRPRTVVRRRINATDPSNDTVRSLIFWSGQGKERLGATLVADAGDLRVESGRRQLDGIVATAAGDGITVVAPPGAVYAQLGVICFGGIHVTDIEVIDLVDVTDAVVNSPGLSDVESRLGGLESQQLPAKVADLQATIGAPNTKTYPSRVAAQSETVPATATTLRTLGYLTPGDGGDDFYSRTGSSAGDFQTNNGSVGWRRVVGPVRPEQFGAKGDGTTNDRAALISARAYALANTVSLILSRPYAIGTAEPGFTFGAITVQPGPAARLVGNYDLHDAVSVTSPLLVERQDQYNRYVPAYVFPGYKRPLTEKTRDVSEGDINYGRTVKIPPATALLLQRLNWGAGNVDDWVAENMAFFDDNLLGYELTNDGYFHGGFRPAFGGDELSTSWDPGAYTRAAVIRGTFGTILAYTQSDGNMTIATKLIGQAATVQTGIDWTGREDQPTWYPSNNVWTIRLFSPTQWTLMMNGVEIMQPRIIPSGFITHIGFAAAASASVRAVMNSFSLTRSTRSPGRAYFDIAISGDSTSADIHGSYPPFLLETLHGSLGAVVRRMINLAGDGHTSVQQFSVLQSADLTGISDVVLNIGTNDVQNPGAAGTRAESLARIGQMIDYLQAKFIRVTVLVFPTWYDKDRTANYPGGPVGVYTANAALSSTYRQGIKAVAAVKNCKVVDLNEELEPPMVYALTNAQPDKVLRDGIHPTELRYREIGKVAAAGMLGQWPQKTRKLPEINLPPVLFSNNWVPHPQTPKIAFTADGFVKLGGTVTGGSKSAGGVIVLRLPINTWPKSQKYGFLRGGVTGQPISFILSTNGTLTVYTDTENEIGLDMIPAFEVAD